MSYITVPVRLHCEAHRNLMNRAAVKGRTVTDLAGEVLAAGIQSRAAEALELAWSEYRTAYGADLPDLEAARRTFAAGWEAVHGRVGGGTSR
ncbi:hypothetical protein [Nocardia sp. NPDC019395]|uniref:hypothetical protein n=1 Tax=Nocardia sp. NPDC019395 TaxID=3154686 RepID=UPI0033F7901A